jgi:hypothetical protein
MKTIYSRLFILTFFTSCVEDTSSSAPMTSNRELFNTTTTVLPGNTLNPYDEAGWIHNALFETYYESSNKPTTVPVIISRVETIAASNPNFTILKTVDYHPVAAVRMQYLMDHKTTFLSEVIASSTLSSGAKLSLSSFMTSFQDKFAVEPSCDSLYKYVVAYEKTVLDNTTFNLRDKQLMLTTTSIARHTGYLAKKKPKKNTDPDWNILVLHLAATLDGAEYGTAESVSEGLVAGIVSN